MVIHLVLTVTFYVNTFVWKCGVSQILPPVKNLEGIALDYNLHFQVIFGEYVHMYNSTDNTMKSRTTGAIALGPSGNLQGGVSFYSLTTGKILHRTKEYYDSMKMPVDAIRRIKYICKQQKSVPGLTFSDCNNIDDVITGVNEGQQEIESRNRNL